MMTQDNDKEMRIVKIPLKDFIDTLLEIQSMGAHLIDLTVTKNTEKDFIGITIREDYTRIDKPLTDEDITKLLE